MVANFTALQLFIAYNFRKSSKNQLHNSHLTVYCTIYRCIVIHKWQYINTPKLCVVASCWSVDAHAAAAVVA